jgi:threonyl-tRNA synthetase
MITIIALNSQFSNYVNVVKEYLDLNQIPYNEDIDYNHSLNSRLMNSLNSSSTKHQIIVGYHEVQHNTVCVRLGSRVIYPELPLLELVNIHE